MHFSSLCWTLGPRWAKIAPRALQEAPKSPPRAAQEPPRAAPRGPWGQIVGRFLIAFKYLFCRFFDRFNSSPGTVAGMARRATGYIRRPPLGESMACWTALAQALAKFLFKIFKILFRQPSALPEITQIGPDSPK